MGRFSTIQRAIVVGVTALATVLAVPAASGTPAAENRAENPAASTAANAPADIPRASPAQAGQQTVATESAVDAAAHAATALARTPGYAGVEVDYATGRVTVAWKGDAPASVLALAGRVPDGVVVDVQQTTLSEADLRAASTRLLDSQRTLHGSGAVLAALPAEDRAGLIVEIPRSAAAAMDPRAAPAAQVPALAKELEQAAGVPVQVRLIDADVETTSVSRRDDDSPWHAGGAIAEKDGTDYCTTGFAVVLPAGDRRIVSAAHCNSKIGAVVRDGVGQRLGTVTHRALGLDAELIKPSGSTSNNVFGGAWDAAAGSPRYRFPVVGVQRPAVGQKVCTSGAVTGEHCDVTIRATDVAWNCGDETCHGFRASRDDEGVVVGGGDSGGPIYGMVDGKAYARGMIDGGSNRRSCTETSVSTQCFSYVYGIPMVDILDHWSATLSR